MPQLQKSPLRLQPVRTGFLSPVTEESLPICSLAVPHQQEKAILPCTSPSLPGLCGSQPQGKGRHKGHETLQNKVKACRDMEDKDTVWQTACGFVFLWFVDQKKKKEAGTRTTKEKK